MTSGRAKPSRPLDLRRVSDISQRAMAIDSDEALRRLREGNRRFVDLSPEARTRWDRASATEARPFAAVLCCSDARAPAEFVFDVGLGDLFVIRVAGNIVAPSQVGSIEFAVDAFEVPLVLVMGHTRCGAIAAAARQMAGEPPTTENVLRITSRIRPIIEPVLATPGLADPLRAAMRANVLASVAQLSHGSRMIEQLVRAGRLRVVGAEYELESGRVRFLEHDQPGAG
jgi:carbonic anhydrase